MGRSDFRCDSRALSVNNTDKGISGVDVYPPLTTELADDAPVIVVNHGLTGGSHESYVRNLVVWLTKPIAEGGLGGRAAVVNVSWSNRV